MYLIDNLPCGRFLPISAMRLHASRRARPMCARPMYAEGITSLAPVYRVSWVRSGGIGGVVGGL